MADIRKEGAIGLDCREVEPLNSLWNTITACLLHDKEQSEQIAFNGKTYAANVISVKAGDELPRICVTLKDISSFVSLQNEFLKRNKELVITNTLSGAFISSSDMEHAYHDLLEKVLIITDFNIGWIALRENDEFVLKGAHGVSGEFRELLEDRDFDFLFKDMAESDDPIYVFDSDRDGMPAVLRKEGVVFLASIPLRAEGELVGVLCLASRVGMDFDFDFASLLSLIGNNLSLIAEKIMLFQETRRLAVTDALTGLYNTRYFYDILNSEVARTLRYSTPFSLILFDIDDFKALNDTYGHQAGDEVLLSFARVLKETSRKTDTVARYGGEEFISILPNTGRDKAFSLAVRIKEVVESTAFLGEEAIRITISGGVATFPDDAADAKELLYAADMAMYRAKAAGKKRIKCYREKEDDSGIQEA